MKRQSKTKTMQGIEKAFSNKQIDYKEEKEL